MLLTKGQIHKIERAQLLGKDRISIRLTVPQIKANTEHTGGFLWSLARIVGPAIVKGLASYATSKGFEIMFEKDLLFKKIKNVQKSMLLGMGFIYLHIQHFRTVKECLKPMKMGSTEKVYFWAQIHPLKTFPC